MEKTRQLLNSTQIMIGNNKNKDSHNLSHSIWHYHIFFLSISINDHCAFNSLYVVNEREREKGRCETKEKEQNVSDGSRAVGAKLAPVLSSV